MMDVEVDVDVAIHSTRQRESGKVVRRCRSILDRS